MASAPTLARLRSSRWLLLAVPGLLALASLAAAAENPAEARMRKDLGFLASDECEGRGISTKGISKAADFISAEFKKASLKPVTTNPGYFQPFAMRGSARLGSPNTFRLTSPKGEVIELKMDSDFRPLGLSASGKLTAPVVFAGYAVTAKDVPLVDFRDAAKVTGWPAAWIKGVGYDDFQGLDVANKVVLIIRKAPRSGSARPPIGAMHQSLERKLYNADQHKAAAVLIVNDLDLAGQGDTLMDFAYTAFSGSKNPLPAIHLKREIGETMVKAGLPTTLKALEKDIDRDLKPRGAPLKGWKAQIEVRVDREKVPVKNVIGILEGAGPLAKETVVIGAHYDHLGYGGPGSLDKEKKKAIHHGADDNGSGTATILELARHFGSQKNRQGRRLVFIAFTGEESGLFGSEHYVQNPLFPLADTVAMVNLDMVGRLRDDKLIVYGTGTSKDFDSAIDKLNKKHKFNLKKIPGGIAPSDNTSFYQKKIPVFFFFTGDHKDYHRPTDTADKINYAGMAKVCGMVADVADYLATVPDRPNYIKVASAHGTGPGAFSGPRLGIRPNYGDDQPGVLISGVSDGGPAAKAGMKEGDRIVELGGKPVRSLETYMLLLARHRKGHPVEVGIVRDGKKQTITVTPE